MTQTITRKIDFSKIDSAPKTGGSIDGYLAHLDGHKFFLKSTKISDLAANIVNAEIMREIQIDFPETEIWIDTATGASYLASKEIVGFQHFESLNNSNIFSNVAERHKEQLLLASFLIDDLHPQNAGFVGDTVSVVDFDYIVADLEQMVSRIENSAGAKLQSITFSTQNLQGVKQKIDKYLQKGILQNLDEQLKSKYQQIYSDFLSRTSEALSKAIEQSANGPITGQGIFSNLNPRQEIAFSQQLTDEGKDSYADLKLSWLGEHINNEDTKKNLKESIILYLSRDYDGALEKLEKCKAGCDHGYLEYLEALCYLDKPAIRGSDNPLEKSRNAANAAIRKNYHNEYTKYLLGRINFKSNNFQEALALFNESENINTKNAQFYYYRGFCQFNLEQSPGNAIEDFRKCIEMTASDNRIIPAIQSKIEILKERVEDAKSGGDIIHPIVTAVKNGNTESTQKLLKSYSTLDINTNFKGQTILELAKSLNHQEPSESRKDIVNMIAHKQKEECKTSMFKAIEKRDVAEVQKLLQKEEIANAIDYNKIHVMVKAVEIGNAEIVQMLLEHGAVLDEKTSFTDINRKHWKILDRAQEMGNQEIVNIISKKLNDQLFDATINKEMRKAVELLEQGANPNATDEHNIHIMVKAVESGNAEIVQALLDQGTVLDEKTSFTDGNKNHWEILALTKDWAEKNPNDQNRQEIKNLISSGQDRELGDVTQKIQRMVQAQGQTWDQWPLEIDDSAKSDISAYSARSKVTNKNISPGEVPTSYSQLTNSADDNGLPQISGTQIIAATIAAACFLYVVKKLTGFTKKTQSRDGSRVGDNTNPSTTTQPIGGSRVNQDEIDKIGKIL